MIKDTTQNLKMMKSRLVEMHINEGSLNQRETQNAVDAFQKDQLRKRESLKRKAPDVKRKLM